MELRGTGNGSRPALPQGWSRKVREVKPRIYISQLSHFIQRRSITNAGVINLAGICRQPEKHPRWRVQLPNHAQSKKISDVKAERQARGLGGILCFHIGASHLFVPRTFEGANDVLTSPTNRRDGLAEL